MKAVFAADAGACCADLELERSASLHPRCHSSRDNAALDDQKNPCAHKNEVGTSTPPKVQKFRKGGWRSGGVVAKKSFLCQRLRPLCPFRRRDTLLEPFLATLGGFVCRQAPHANPLSKPLTFPENPNTPPPPETRHFMGMGVF